MKKIILGLIAAAAVAAPIAITAGSASAAVIDHGNGSVHVDKSDIQAAFKWNNADFDVKQEGLTFSLNGDYSQTYHFDGSVDGANFHGSLVTNGITQYSTIETEVKSANGKQISGWDLTPAAAQSGGTTDYAHSTLNRAMNEFTMANMLGGTITEPARNYVTTEGVTSTVTVTFNDVTKVLPLTPTA